MDSFGWLFHAGELHAEMKSQASLQPPEISWSNRMGEAGPG